MGKKSKRPGREARDVHATIRATAEALKSTGRTRVHMAAKFPELEALLTAASDAVFAAVPSTFEHEGRKYWLRVTLGMGLQVFAGPAEGEALVRGARYCTNEHGHAPAH